MTIYDSLMAKAVEWRRLSDMGTFCPPLYPTDAADELEALAKQVCAEACESALVCSWDEDGVGEKVIALDTVREIIGAQDFTTTETHGAIY